MVCRAITTLSTEVVEKKSPRESEQSSLCEERLLSFSALMFCRAFRFCLLGYMGAVVHFSCPFRSNMKGRKEHGPRLAWISLSLPLINELGTLLSPTGVVPTYLTLNISVWRVLSTLVTHIQGPNK